MRGEGKRLLTATTFRCCDVPGAITPSLPKRTAPVCTYNSIRDNRPTLIRNLLEGQYEELVRIVAFNTAQGWSRDVTVDIR
jgi:hypothetical protein